MDEKTEIFCCYAHKHEDQQLLSKLKTHLASFEREGLINIWHDADIILLLISPSFIASEYCYSREMKRAMERHNQGEACVIPIILRPVSWHNAPFGKLQALPIEAKPVTDPGWPSLDDAFLNVLYSFFSSNNALPEARQNTTSITIELPYPPMSTFFLTSIQIVQMPI